ncbi:N-acetylmuramoyl-L-alanine amidase family protein [Aromatoleum buckelii]|uniref:N-acetylmuramoyl-L-alanine amidase n=1 Tax=Aromatoleum buckelii TaxID=200254 RepID=A0ABX1N1J8_9RHOO|nr:N-acetylmuramoyl-L-alanine amidase [Aromatoleum buckelii]MCK0509954.1 N-acetylmuramoyl-L-alanine amidase [Aromatoleum buckelii]
MKKSLAYRTNHWLPCRLVVIVGVVAAGMAVDAHADSTERPRIAVDIGHTLAASGATSARGRTEFEFNRDLALQVSAALERLDVRAELVNAEGAIESLAARPAQVPDAEFFLSIHHDSVSESELEYWEWQGETQRYSDRWAGHSLFVSRRNPDLGRSVLCAVTIGARLQRAGFVSTQKNGRQREYADRQHAVHFYDNLVVLYRARQPAVLFEAGVIKHRDEELLLREPRRQALMAGEIATGIAACLAAGR